MGANASLPAVEQDVAAANLSQPDGVDVDSLSIADGRLHADSRSAETNRIPTAEQVAGNIRESIGANAFRGASIRGITER
jgi:hypothetical protein